MKLVKLVNWICAIETNSTSLVGERFLDSRIIPSYFLPLLYSSLALGVGVGYPFNTHKLELCSIMVIDYLYIYIK